MAATSIIICAELGGVIVDLACYAMSAFVIAFGLNTVKSFIESRGYKVKEGESQAESKSQDNKIQSYKLEYNYRNKLEDLGNVYFFSDYAKGMLSSSFLPLGLILKDYGNIPTSCINTLPEKNKIPPYEVFPIPEHKRPTAEVFPNEDNTIKIFDKSHNIQIAFFVKVTAQNGDIVEVPQRLLGKDGRIIISNFGTKIKHTTGKKEEGGWYIERDTGKHGGKVKKLKDPKGNRVASLDENGKILSK